ncbi:MAG: hypothetical protein H7281_02585 [Bacteriovorax sp.]|nr:hypothetical protein [Bacteriovorax sp.]
MKYLSLVSFIFLISNSAFALIYRAQCTGNRGGVAVSIYTSKDKLFMRYSNVLGAQDFPFYEGSVSKLAMPFIKIAQTELASIDHEVLLSWPVEKCTFSTANPLLMECNGAATFIIPEKSELKSFTFFTSIIKEDSLTSSYEIFKIRWGIEGLDYHHSIGMPFDPKLCQAEYIP